MNKHSRIALLGACAAAIVGCGDSTGPSTSTNGNSRFPMLTNYGGHLLSPLRLVAVVAGNDSLRDSLFAFAKALPASHWWPAVATPYGVSPTATAVTVTGPPITAGTVMTLADIDAYVQAAAIDSAGYGADGRTVYAIFLPPGVSCTETYCVPPSGAFHVPFGSTNALAVLVRFQGATLQTETVAASHEIIESATDPEEDAWKLVSPFHPWTGSPWGLDDGGSFEENADICVGTKFLDGGFYYQRVFSNQAAALGGDPCVPTIATPYFNVTTSGWYSTTTGEVSIPITGWSTGTRPEWVLTASSGPHTASLTTAALSFSCPDTLLVNGGRYCGINTGKTATLHVVLPPGAVSQTFFSFHLFSVPVSANGQIAPGDDNFHTWIVGVYVP